MQTRIFKDRNQAGRLLAEELEQYKDQNPLVLGIPRGGVVVAYEVAKILKAELDVIVARKLGAPLQPELAIGAIAPGNVQVLDRATVNYFDLSESDIQRIVASETEEMDRRIAAFRAGKPDLDVNNRVVIIVDDGLATGQTALAAVRAVKKMGAKEIVLAVPVCAKDTKVVMLDEVDNLICMLAPRDFAAVGYWYESFTQVEDSEVIRILKK